MAALEIVVSEGANNGPQVTVGFLPRTEKAGRIVQARRGVLPIGNKQHIMAALIEMGAAEYIDALVQLGYEMGMRRQIIGQIKQDVPSTKARTRHR